MDATIRRRILVAVQPTVLEGAFAVLLGHGDRAEVVQFHKATADELSDHYDAAIVTAGLVAEVHSEVLITLPNTEAGRGVARVTVGTLSRAVSVGRPEEMGELLADHFGREISAHRST